MLSEIPNGLNFDCSSPIPGINLNYSGLDLYGNYINTHKNLSANKTLMHFAASKGCTKIIEFLYKEKNVKPTQEIVWLALVYKNFNVEEFLHEKCGQSLTRFIHNKFSLMAEKEGFFLEEEEK